LWSLLLAETPGVRSIVGYTGRAPFPILPASERRDESVDHYRQLQVTRTADAEVIDRAYKTLSMKYHPDKVDGSQTAEATRRMQAINEAHAVLRDPAKRRAYDATLPREGAEGWDVFWERGLLGLFIDRFASQDR